MGWPSCCQWPSAPPANVTRTVGWSSRLRACGVMTSGDGPQRPELDSDSSAVYLDLVLTSSSYHALLWSCASSLFQACPAERRWCQVSLMPLKLMDSVPCGAVVLCSNRDDSPSFWLGLHFSSGTSGI